MTFSTTDLDRINAAIATGELEVELEGKRVRYRSVAELINARNLIIADLTASGALTTAGVRTSYATFSKG